MKKWSELNASGKGELCVRLALGSGTDRLCRSAVTAARATARTTNALVILFGAGFTGMLGYALISELFSKNSPTVLHAQACELIKSSPKVRPLVYCTVHG